VTRPLGGFVIWVELPGEIDTMQLYDASIAAGFSFAPGRIFSASDRYRNCLRLSCGHPWSAAPTGDCQARAIDQGFCQEQGKQAIVSRAALA
jgi:DNA-binding transcriptional MocR family regulator